MARTPVVRAESCGVRERLRRLLAVIVWQVGLAGWAGPRSVLQGGILSPTDGPGRIGQFSIGEIIASHPQLSTPFFWKNPHRTQTQRNPSSAFGAFLESKYFDMFNY